MHPLIHIYLFHVANFEIIPGNVETCGHSNCTSDSKNCGMFDVVHVGAEYLEVSFSCA